MTSELYFYKTLEGRECMSDMTAGKYELLRDKVLDFLQYKSDDIDLPKWSYVEVYTILSVCREYYENSLYCYNNSIRRRAFATLIDVFSIFFFFQIGREKREN